MAREGAKVAVIARSENKINNISDEIDRQKGIGISMPIPTDFSDESQVKPMVGKVEKEFGEVDVLINNASYGFISSLLETKTKDWDLTMEVNLRGIFLCTREVVSSMIKGKSGRIINISSKAGNQAFGNINAYCASKYGVIGFSEALARELSEHHINVNVICPDSVVTKMATDFFPNANYSNWMKPEDMDGLFVFLSSDESYSVNGAIINAYGYAELMG